MEIPGLVVIVVVIAVVAAIGIGAFVVIRESPSDRDDRGPYSSSAEATGSFAAFGTTVDHGQEGGADGGGGDGGGGGD